MLLLLAISKVTDRLFPPSLAVGAVQVQGGASFGLESDLRGRCPPTRYVGPGRWAAPCAAPTCYTPPYTTLRGLLLLPPLAPPVSLDCSPPASYRPLFSSHLGLDELTIETQHLPTMVEAMGLEADRPPSEELPAPRPPPPGCSGGSSGDAAYAEQQQQQHTSEGHHPPLPPQLLGCRDSDISGSVGGSRTACAPDERQGLPQLRPEAPPGSDIVPAIGGSRGGSAADNATAERQLLTGRVSALSIGQDNSGGTRLIRFAQNAGGSRRFLVSRSGHVFVARGQTVVCMVAPSVSSFLQRLLT